MPPRGPFSACAALGATGTRVVHVSPSPPDEWPRRNAKPTTTAVDPFRGVPSLERVRGTRLLSRSSFFAPTFPRRTRGAAHGALNSPAQMHPADPRPSHFPSPLDDG